VRRLTERHVVVCVDDEPAILSALRRTLRQEPYHVLTTDRPETALRWIDSREVSLVITDQRMPDIRGTELLEKVLERSPSTARVILTAYPEDAIATVGLRQKVECLIRKPWDGPMLKRLIRDLLAKRELDGKEEGDRRC
jgi:response regulator RpfG family c-di-GMP phosphodiesterase